VHDQVVVVLAAVEPRAVVDELDGAQPPSFVWTVKLSSTAAVAGAAQSTTAASAVNAVANRRMNLLIIGCPMTTLPNHRNDDFTGRYC
jgi:hypothetical protein